MKVQYIENYIIVNSEGITIYSDDEEIHKIPEEMKRYAFENFKTFYMCSQQRRKISPEDPMPIIDTIAKLRILAPTREAAEKAAARANAAGTPFYFWIEPIG